MTAGSKGGRPATGSASWNPERKAWEARVTRLDGTRHPPVLIPDVPEHDAEQARRVARIISDSIRNGGGVPRSTPETVNEYAERWLEARKNATVGHDRGRLKNHVQPVIGTLAMVDVGREDVERVVQALDRKIALPETDPDHLAWKTAANVWSVVTKMFKDAVSAKAKALRVREDNPTTDVAPPDRGDRRAKSYLYPSEFLRLVSCEAVPLPFRMLYATAVCTFARAGELQALTWNDVDLEHGVIHVTKAVNRLTGEITSTKSGETRRIPIEPALLPLLQRLHAERASDAVLWMPEHEDRAVKLREHLLAAGVVRHELHTDDAHSRHVVFHDLRSTGITWAAVRGDDPLKIMQRAGHSDFATTQGYIREAENLRSGFGEPFPELPIGFRQVLPVLAGKPSNSSVNQWSKGGSNP